jgi:site-specific DNA recombinase
MKYILYARKSTESEERQILSIEAQLAELQEYAAKEKLEIVASLCEAQTAKEPGRTKFAEMLSFLKDGKADGIISWHPDRLARNSIDGGQIVYLLDTGKIKDLKFPTFWFENTPQGKFMLNIAFGQSKYYVDNLSENIRRGHRAKLRRGVYPGSAPLGYLNNSRTRDIDIDPERAEMIRKGFELYATGKYTLKQIARAFKDMGLRSHKGNVLAVSCVQRMLSKSFYYGVFVFKGETYEGAHEPIVTKKLFDTCQEVMKYRGHIKTRKAEKTFPFRGLMACGECGCAITAETQKGYNYYRCTKKREVCSQKYIREEILTEQVKGFFQKVSLSSQDAEKVLCELDKDEQKAKSDNHAIIQNLKSEVADIGIKLDKLLSAYLDEIVSAEEYVAQKQKLLSRKVEYTEEINEIENGSVSWLEPARVFVKSLNHATKLIQNGDKSEMTTFLKQIGSNHILIDKSFSFVPKNQYKLTAERSEADSSQLQIPFWRRGWDSNPRYRFRHNGFRDRPIRPLWHPSQQYISNCILGVPPWSSTYGEKVMLLLHSGTPPTYNLTTQW